MINVKWRLMCNGLPRLYLILCSYVRLLHLYRKSTTFITNMCKPAVTTTIQLYDESVTSIKNIQIPFARDATFMVHDDL